MPSYPYPQGYCDEDDVTQLLPNIEAYSKLSPERLRIAVADTAAEMDALLSRFYLTPVSGDVPALAILRVINKELAVAFIRLEFDRASNAKAAPTSWKDQAYELLDQIVPPRHPDGSQPYPTIRFLTAPLQSPTELPAFPAGTLAQMNPDNDAGLHPEQGPYFQRTDRMPWRDGTM